MKQTNKKMMVVFTMMMLTTISVNVYATEADDSYSDIEEEIVAQEPACQAFEKLMSIIETEDGYPDEYGGCYIEDNQLVIELTELTESNEELYREYTEDSDVIEFQKVEYSFNELNEIAEAVVEADISSVTCVGVGEMTNTVEIDVNGEDESVVWEAVSAAMPEMACLEESAEELPITINQSGEVRVATTKIKGGMKLTTNGMAMSVCACGTYDGSPAILTCGHEMVVGKDVKIGGVKVGEVVKKRFSDGKAYDYGIIK